MPVATAELAIGNGVITSTLLLLDQAGDLLIFHSGQRGTVDLAGLELGTPLSSAGGAGSRPQSHNGTVISILPYRKTLSIRHFSCSLLDGNSIPQEWVCVKYEIQAL